MKRSLKILSSLALCACVILGFTACGNNGLSKDTKALLEKAYKTGVTYEKVETKTGAIVALTGTVSSKTVAAEAYGEEWTYKASDDAMLFRLKINSGWDSTTTTSATANAVIIITISGDTTTYYLESKDARFYTKNIQFLEDGAESGKFTITPDSSATNYTARTLELALKLIEDYIDFEA